MAEINANIVVQPIELSISANTPGITVEPPPQIGLNVFTSGYAQPGGDPTQLQYNLDGQNFDGISNTSFVNGNLTLGNVGNVKILGGNNAFFLQTDGSGNLTWAQGTANVSGNGTADGANGLIQLSDGTGNFRSGSGFNFDTGTNALSVPGNLTVSANANIGNIRSFIITANGTFIGDLTGSTVVANVSANVRDLNISNGFSGGINWVGLAIGTRRVRINAGNSGLANGQTVINMSSNVGNHANSVTINGSQVSAESVVIGHLSQAAGSESVSIGRGAGGAGTINIRGVAIGYNSQRNKPAPVGATAGAIAIGAEAGLFQHTGAIALGQVAGYYGADSNGGQGNNSISIGVGSSGKSYDDAIAIGTGAGRGSNGANIQGTSSIAIGNLAGFESIHNNSIILNATGSNLDTTQANTFIVKPIRNLSNTNVLMYNSTSGEITYNELVNYAGYIKTIVVDVANLTAAATIGAGGRAFVTDANTTTFNAIVGSGGANSVPVFSDGTDWRVG